MEKMISKSEEAHKDLLEAFDRAKELHKKIEVENRRTKTQPRRKNITNPLRMTPVSALLFLLTFTLSFTPQ